MPARVVDKLGGIVGALIHRVLAAHLYVTAERDGGDAVVGVSLAEADQPLAETNRKDLNPHPQQLGHRIVAELVDQDHEAQDWDNVKVSERTKKLRHIKGTYSPLC